MTRQEFDDGLARYGADFSRWPAALRDAAERLVAEDAAAARELAEARRLDALLAETMRPVTVDPALAARIVGGVGGRARNGNDLQLRPTGRLIALTAAAMVVAVMIGFTAGYVVQPDDSEEAIATLVFGGATDDEEQGDWL
jgi:anti-sigma factor RsiW